MDNMSGSTAWTVQDTPEKETKEEVKVDAPKVEFVLPDITPLREFIELGKQRYKESPNKTFGDALVYLESADKLIKGLWKTS